MYVLELPARTFAILWLELPLLLIS